MAAAAGCWWQCNITVCMYMMMYFGLGVQKTHKVLMAYTMRTRGRWRLRAKLGWSSAKTPTTRPWIFASAIPVAGCTWADRLKCQRISGKDPMTGSALVLPHARFFVSWLLQCTHRKQPCFLLVAMLMRCYALPRYPRRSNRPVLVAVANANALQLPLPPKPSWPVSPVLWVLRHAVGHLRQPWDPRDRARQETPVSARCPVTSTTAHTARALSIGYSH